MKTRHTYSAQEKDCTKGWNLFSPIAILIQVLCGARILLEKENTNQECGSNQEVSSGLTEERMNMDNRSCLILPNADIDIEYTFINRYGETKDFMIEMHRNRMMTRTMIVISDAIGEEEDSIYVCLDNELTHDEDEYCGVNISVRKNGKGVCIVFEED